MNRSEVVSDVTDLFNRKGSTMSRDELVVEVRGIYLENPQLGWAIKTIDRLVAYKQSATQSK